VNAAWPAPRMAAAVQEAFRRYYGDALDIDRTQVEMDKIWVNLHQWLTEEQRLRIGEITHISIPSHDLTASITSPPSRQGYFIVFDAMLDYRMWELFTAPRNTVAWAACYVRAAWGSTLEAPNWLVPARDRLRNIRSSRLPDSYSLGAARDFIFAHECGHFYLQHLDRGTHSNRSFLGGAFQAYDPSLREEIEADQFARDLLCRNEGHWLPLQQMGVDWLFGFLDGVFAMRRRVDARLNGHPEPPMASPGIAERRAAAWADYNRRCHESPIEEARAPGNVAAVRHVRENVDNFNKVFPLILADIRATLPNELQEWQERVVRSQITDDDVAKYDDELRRLWLKSGGEQRWPIGWRQRLQQWLENLF